MASLATATDRRERRHTVGSMAKPRGFFSQLQSQSLHDQIEQWLKCAFTHGVVQRRPWEPYNPRDDLHL